jgi:hypothetical protein
VCRDHGPSTATSANRRARASDARYVHVLRAAVAAVGLSAIAGCRPPPDPITVQGDVVTVDNQTDEAWLDVEVWVNDHYRVTLPRLAPRGRFHAPLGTFVAGFGQRFDIRRQRVSGIEVTARTETGAGVTKIWGKGRRR